MTFSLGKRVFIMAAAGVLSAGSGAAVASAASASPATLTRPATVPRPAAAGRSALDIRMILRAAGLTVGTTDQGYVYGRGAAHLVATVSQALYRLSVDQIAMYSGRNETGVGVTVVSGNPGLLGACIDGPSTLQKADNVDDLTGDADQVRAGTCAHPGAVDGRSIAPDTDANLPSPAILRGNYHSGTNNLLGGG
ncbi:MAG TPA: hypothetical protein VMU95_21770 [Trebonia sp.]|nr:hypothetical protein [Trebonia sp.]